MLNFSTKLCGGFVYVHLAGLPAGHTALSADADTAITDQNTKTSKNTNTNTKTLMDTTTQKHCVATTGHFGPLALRRQLMYQGDHRN